MSEVNKDKLSIVDPLICKGGEKKNPSVDKVLRYIIDPKILT
jgi:hypothetical protein